MHILMSFRVSESHIRQLLLIPGLVFLYCTLAKVALDLPPLSNFEF